MTEIACPKCAETLNLSIAAAVGKDQKFSYRVYPEKENMMQAKVIGGQLVAMDDLMRACARQDGGKVRTYIDRIETHADGSLEFFLVALPVVAWDEAKGRFVSKPASGIEAGTGQTAQQAGSRSDESPAPKGDAQGDPS